MYRLLVEEYCGYLEAEDGPDVKYEPHDVVCRSMSEPDHIKGHGYMIEGTIICPLNKAELLIIALFDEQLRLEWAMTCLDKMWDRLR